MKLHAGRPYWPETAAEIKKYPTLEEEVTCDVLIVGGGIAGSLCAEELSQTALKTVVVEKGTIGSGSSLTNTGLLHYSSNLMLHELAEELGEEKAVHFYSLCLEAIQELQKVSGTLTERVDFVRRPGLNYASNEADVEKLKKEYEILSKHDFEVEYYTQDKIKELFGFEKPAALMIHGNAEVNPLRLVHSLIKTAHSRGVEIYEHTEVTAEGTEGEHQCFVASNGTKILAKKVIYSTGYQSFPFENRSVAELKETFAIATAPVENLADWTYQALIWETKRPYFYMRTTEDNRIIAGGLDEEEGVTSLNAQKLEEKGERLLERIKEHFPALNLKVSHAWSTQFGGIKDGLPLIGPDPEKENVYYCLGFGVNGVLYCKLGARLLGEMLQGEENEEAEMFSLSRLS
ncbi:NAD(P)/FAD-dependent oxidoreductase [Jeotgalibacillus proteolyticus]|uniref:FAD dependent oxidoreductase domain-containing protein n=1 Tax=Jeotgalibacillus proteolyticus TaxID=2082395 RepID=A0A2S5GAB9_9BACL|nr:FAD-dependent oxidoreductase [Jeotgalibacillus proteolyticus]PPA69929.1 hypothetical protein C4B60_15505 [Jeotgalibacillus proteolyticus]